MAKRAGGNSYDFRWEPVTTRSSGETLSLGIHSIAGQIDGAVLGLFSTSHGDEAFTIELIRQMVLKYKNTPIRGKLVAMPVANPIAFESFTRTTGQGMNTDKNNMNRVFPGSPDGWLTEQMAHVVSTRFVDHLDYLVDFHCGGLDTAIDYVLVHDEGGPEDAESRRLSLLCGTPILYETDTPAHSGTLTDYSKEMGIPSVLAEFGGCMASGPEYVEKYMRGLENIMVDLGMIDGTVVLPQTQRILKGKRSLLRPRVGGLFLPEVGYEKLGRSVPKGTMLGRVVSPHTFEELDVMVAPYDETVIFMLRGVMSRVNPGDYAYILGNAAGAIEIRN